MKNQKVLLPDGRLVPLNRLVYSAGLDNENAFLWKTHKDEYILVTEMATPHLMNAVRMLFNHTVPPALRIGKFIRYLDVFEWSNAYKAEAMEALLAELDDRTDLESAERFELDDMSKNTDFYLSALGA